jgi:hypothetical protein
VSATITAVNTVGRERSTWASAIMIPVSARPVQTARATTAGGRYAGFAPADSRLDSLQEEVRRLRAQHSVDAVSPQTLAESRDTAIHELIDLIDSDAIDNHALDRMMRALAGNKGLLATLATLDSMNELAGVVQRKRRRDGLGELRAAVDDRTTTLAGFRRILQREWWMFGSHLTPWLKTDDIPGLDATSIPLIRYDGAIHVIIVECAQVPDLVTEQGGYRALSPLIAAASDRGRGIVRALDAKRQAIGDELGIECGRALVTILIGHPEYVAGTPATVVREEIRALSTFSAGINVITYEELLNVAEQTLGDQAD